jgi:uncharacterized membrane protein YqjE
MSLEANPKPDASIGELMTQLSAQVSRLVRDEMRLAQTELRQSAKSVGLGAGLLSGAAVLAAFGMASLITAAIAAIAIALPVWAAALVVGAAVLFASGIAALLGRKRAGQATPAAPQTVANVKKDVQQVRISRHDRS